MSNNNNDIAVTIVCMAYNHESYIKQCLEGFVMQETNFRFEVIVHDDASTDKTADIIKEYEIKYPDIIVPIYQEKNQYSQGANVFNSIIKPIIHGKYLASCEGDDFWTDCHKLQKQYDFMESHPEYSLCLHNATYHFCNGNRHDIIMPNIICDKDYSIEEIIAGDGNLFATNSAFRKVETAFNMPSCFVAKGFGDYQLFIYSAIIGKVHCLSENMSQYNVGASGSWTERIWNVPEKKVDHLREKIRMLTAVDQHYNEKYKEYIDKKILFCNYLIYETQNDKKMLMQKPYRSIYLKRKGLFYINRLVSALDKHFPWMRKILTKFK